MTIPGHPIQFGNFTAPFLDALAAHLQGNRVLEVFAGNGILAAELHKRGISVTATTIFSSHDGHEFGVYHPVLEMDAIQAVSALGSDHDVLLMSWPTTTMAAYYAARIWGAERPIIFIGEVTDYASGVLGGCATDEFFEAASSSETLLGYEPRNILEQALVMHLKPEHDLAKNVAAPEL